MTFHLTVQLFMWKPEANDGIDLCDSVLTDADGEAPTVGSHLHL